MSRTSPQASPEFTELEATSTLFHGLACAAICVLGFAVYANTLSGGEFVLDSIGHIQENPQIRIQTPSWDALSAAAFESIDPRRPIPNVTLALNYYWGGYEMRGYRLFNIAIHLISGLLVYALALLTLRQLASLPSRPFEGKSPLELPATALLAALLFVLHPLQTQSVAYVIQRMTSLSALFYLGALLCYVLARRHRGSVSKLLWLSVPILWALALMSKQIAITLPAVILLYEWFFFRDLDTQWLRRNSKSLAGALVGAALLLFIVGVFAAGYTTEEVFRLYEHRDFTLQERLLTQLRVLCLYLSLLFFPHPGRLNLSHHMETSRSLTDPTSTLLALLTLTAILAAAVVYARRHRLVCFAVFWFFINLLLESTIIPLELIFEHRLYLPLVGPAIAVAYLMHRAYSHSPRLALGAALCLVAALGWGTWERNRAWESLLAIWGDSVAKSPESFRAQYDYGISLAAADQNEAAIEHFERAVALDPESADAVSSYGASLSRVDRLEEATGALEAAMRLEMDSAERRYRVGAIYRMRGQLHTAIAYYQDALELEPHHAAARRELVAVQSELLR